LWPQGLYEGLVEKILAQWGRIFSEDLAEIGLETSENELVLD